MRQGKALALSVLLLLCIVAASAAQQGNPRDPGGTAATGGAAPAAPVPPAPPAGQGNPQDVGGTANVGRGGSGYGTGHAKHAAHCTYRGTVASVDATAKSFVVHPAKGDDVTLKLNDKTKYSPKGKTWDDVKADAKVSGTCKKDGADTWAVSLKFWPAPKAKAEPAAKGGNPGDIGGPPTKTGAM